MEKESEGERGKRWKGLREGRAIVEVEEREREKDKDKEGTE